MSEARFREGIRANVRGLWVQAITRDQFVENMTDLITRELWNAWVEGIDSCGMTVADMEPEDRELVQSKSWEQLDYLDGFANDIVVNNKFFGGSLEALFSRADMWINQYKSMRDLAKTTVCGDTKYEWVYGDTEHCDSCLRLNGIVKRASVWERANVRPGNPPNWKLECDGWHCECTLQPTSKRSTPGPLPSLP